VIREKHNRAMELACTAFLAKREGRYEEARGLLSQALVEESAAAAGLQGKGEAAPPPEIAKELKSLKLLIRARTSKGRGCPTCLGVDPQTCMRCGGKTRLCDWFNGE
jgi:hypothetical protein